MDKIVDNMAAHICDNLCKHSVNGELSQEELECICAECELGKFLCDILNTYNTLNDFEQSQIHKILEKYDGFVRCKDCANREVGSEGTAWCDSCNGLACHLKDTDGCSRGKLKDGIEKTVAENVYEMVSDSDTKGVENG